MPRIPFSFNEPVTRQMSGSNARPPASMPTVNPYTSVGKTITEGGKLLLEYAEKKSKTNMLAMSAELDEIAYKLSMKLKQTTDVDEVEKFTKAAQEEAKRWIDGKSEFGIPHFLDPNVKQVANARLQAWSTKIGVVGESKQIDLAKRDGAAKIENGISSSSARLIDMFDMDVSEQYRTSIKPFFDDMVNQGLKTKGEAKQLYDEHIHGLDLKRARQMLKVLESPEVTDTSGAEQYDEQIKWSKESIEEFYPNLSKAEKDLIEDNIDVLNNKFKTRRNMQQEKQRDKLGADYIRLQLDPVQDSINVFLAKAREANAAESITDTQLARYEVGLQMSYEKKAKREKRAKERAINKTRIIFDRGEAEFNDDIHREIEKLDMEFAVDPDTGPIIFQKVISVAKDANANSRFEISGTRLNQMRVLLDRIKGGIFDERKKAVYKVIRDYELRELIPKKRDIEFERGYGAGTKRQYRRLTELLSEGVSPKIRRDALKELEDKEAFKRPYAMTAVDYKIEMDKYIEGNQEATKEDINNHLKDVLTRNTALDAAKERVTK